MSEKSYNKTIEYEHSVIDSDISFKIDPFTRKITSDQPQKYILMQGDHKCERFTISIPRHIEGHDMYLCNSVKVHFLNTEVQKKKDNRYVDGVYTVTDLHIDEKDSELLTFSWLISGNATFYGGKLGFFVTFSCLSGIEVDYRFVTDYYGDISVVGKLTDEAVFETLYIDIIEQWKEKVMSDCYNYIEARVDAKGDVIEANLEAKIDREFEQMATDVNGRIDEFKTDVDNHIDTFDQILRTEIISMDGAIDVLEARMNTFTSLPEGATTDDAALNDIKVGVDGLEYDTPAEAVRGQISKFSGIYDVTHNHPLNSGEYYTLETAIDAVPVAFRKSGLVITFRESTGWRFYQYSVGVVSDINWPNKSYWVNIGSTADVNYVCRGRISDLGYTSFGECKEYGYYRFLTADVENIADAPADLIAGGILIVYPNFAANVIARIIRDLDGNEWFMYDGINWISSVGKVKRQIESLEDTVNKLMSSDVSWCALGDSITQGYYSYYDENGEPTYVLNPTIGWVNKVAMTNNWVVENKAIGGSGYICKRSVEKPVLNAKEVADATDFSKFNLVTLAYGVNDWKYNCVLGDIGDDVYSAETMCASMRYVIEKILSDNPLCKIVVITPINCIHVGSYESNWGLGYSYSNNGTLDDIFKVIVEVCEYYGIEYVDMTHKSVVNRLNAEALLIDKVHPSEECHTLMAHELAKKIAF